MFFLSSVKFCSLDLRHIAVFLSFCFFLVQRPLEDVAVLVSQWQAMTPKWGSSQVRECNEVRPWRKWSRYF